MQKLTSFKDACLILRLVPADEITPDQKATIIFQAACKLTGVDPLAMPMLDLIDAEFNPSILAHYKLQVIRKAIVGEWVADWNKYERKWSPWFWMNDPGFRFVGSDFVGVYTGVTGGSRLCFETEEQSDFVGQECIALYRDLCGATNLAEAA